MTRSLVFHTAVLDVLASLLPLYGDSTSGNMHSQGGMLLMTALPGLTVAALFIARRLTSWLDAEEVEFS